MENESLKNKTIMITRPEGQGELLKKAIERRGGAVILFSTLIIKPINKCNYSPFASASFPPSRESGSPDDKMTKAGFLNSSDILIFLSANAVKHSPILNFKAEQKLVAIGTGTAAALFQRGLSVDAVPEHFSSEGLLDLPLLHQVTGKTIAIFCGENSRPYLENELIHRGANVFSIITYRRERPVVNKKTIDALTHQTLHAIVSTSAESLQNLCTLFESHQHWLHRIPLVVISKRMENLAKSQGFHLVLLADNPGEKAIIKVLSTKYPS
ncbi:uroporphyrinogen-III synthase [Coxiella burnetii]|uniref:uroporphyrinogen-III synthase n=1 Tax=Coxiella burnetii TaxID=777 RepID=UPI000593CC3E|nr:uroporphyrinogen-III synthase [Coxiella burnetii]ATN75319.1 uroporphyrinogen-III synthase [Coxiella burnetii]ATN77227.1 uroporphyrinogen-III synthase [Coxiella burnetii]ATN79070.1 uroporphyrinogen-III synthase [Coxiella burnetii]ATN80979.1 uroporphyrinogen-III synthase [Coxiella burnetii]OYK89248.1 uroporphyrinogen-III synthase [Coxiella burnetii]